MQLDLDEELGLCKGCMANSRSQRTTKRAELTAILCLLTKIIGLIKVHVDKWSMLKRTAQRWMRKRCRALRSLSQKAVKRLTSWRKKVLCWMKGSWSRRAQDSQAGARRGASSLAVRSQLSLFVEEWKDCEELKPQPKEKWIFVDKKSEVTKHRSIERSGVQMPAGIDA